MQKNEVESVVGKINEFLIKQMWMDFEVTQYKDYELLITGSLDSTTTISDIEIRFQEVFLVSLPFSWQTDTSQVAFMLLSDIEAKEINRRFKIEQGNYIFKFIPEDYPSDFGCYVAAKSISMRINK